MVLSGDTQHLSLRELSMMPGLRDEYERLRLLKEQLQVRKAPVGSPVSDPPCRSFDSSGSGSSRELLTPRRNLPPAQPQAPGAKPCSSNLKHNPAQSQELRAKPHSSLKHNSPPPVQSQELRTKPHSNLKQKLPPAQSQELAKPHSTLKGASAVARPSPTVTFASHVSRPSAASSGVSQSTVTAAELRRFVDGATYHIHTPKGLLKNCFVQIMPQDTVHCTLKQQTVAILPWKSISNITVGSAGADTSLKQWRILTISVANAPPLVLEAPSDSLFRSTFLTLQALLQQRLRTTITADDLTLIQKRLMASCASN
ncbi:hypothetical protein DIPPA_16319 [Diplonema papillatum]|nr:hypothetical protein DIPPA_16319 [Diplonema papillatum]